MKKKKNKSNNNFISKLKKLPLSTKILLSVILLVTSFIGFSLSFYFGGETFEFVNELINDFDRIMM